MIVEWPAVCQALGIRWRMWQVLVLIVVRLTDEELSRRRIDYRRDTCSGGVGAGCSQHIRWIQQPPLKDTVSHLAGSERAASLCGNGEPGVTLMVHPMGS